MIKRIERLWILIVFALLVVATPVLAAYTADISVVEESGTDYDMLGVMQPLNVTSLVTQGYIDANGLDTEVELTGSTIPHMLVNDRLLFTLPLGAHSTKTSQFLTGQTPATSFHIIPGYKGYITTADDADIELGGNFSVLIGSAYINTGIGASKFLIRKANAFSVTAGETVSGNVTALVCTTSSINPADVISGANNAVYYNHAVYATCHDAATGTLDANILIGQRAGYFIYRGGVIFDTSAIPDAATITSAVLHLKGAADFSTTNFNIIVRTGGGTFPSDPMVIGDYAFANYTGNGGTFNTAGFNAAGDNPIPLNATGLSWINKTGVTKFGLLSDEDIASSAPTGDEYVSATEAGTTLTVYYTLDGVGIAVTALGVTTDEHDIEVVGTADVKEDSHDTGDTAVSDFFGANWRAQTFTPTYNYSITDVAIKAYRQGSPDMLTLSIRAVDVATGKPTGADLASGSTNATLFTSTSPGAWYTITLSSAYELSAGTTYAIVVRVPSGNAANYLRWRKGGAYTGGQYVESINSGTTWTVYPAEPEFMFRAYGDRLTLYVDGVIEDTAGGAVVPDNDNDWYWMYNATTDFMPYCDNISITTGGVAKLLYQPNDIISGTILPDLEATGGSEDGTFVWGTLPTGVALTIGGLVYIAGSGYTTEELAEAGALGEGASPDIVLPDSEMTGGGIGWLEPIVADIAELTDTPVDLIWSFLVLICLLLGFGVGMKYTQNLFISGAIGIAVLGAAIGARITQPFVLILIAILLLAALVMERKTAV